MATDGRNIDLSVGTLSGEGSAQIHDRADASANAGVPVWGSVPGVSKSDPTYYDRPVLKKSPWTWDIPAYYYVGGAAGASVAFGAAAQIVNSRDFGKLITGSRWIGVGGSMLSTFFLIHDLGRPERFLYMLRVFRPTSPMSVGVYILTVFANANGLAWLSMWGPEPVRKLGNAAALVAGLFGMGMAGYTAVLVSNTVVPMWYVPRRIMPFLFLASAAASASSLFEMAELTEVQDRAVKTFGIVGKAAEYACMELLEREVARVPQVAEPLRNGFGAMLWKAGKGFAIASAVLSLLPNRSRKLRIADGVFGTAASLCVRFGIHYAGQRSAGDPRATFHQQRALGR